MMFEATAENVKKLSKVSMFIFIVIGFLFLGSYLIGYIDVLYLGVSLSIIAVITFSVYGIYVSDIENDDIDLKHIRNMLLLMLLEMVVIFLMFIVGILFV